MPFIDYYTGKFTDEDTAIKQTIDCTVLSISGEWLSANGAIGTQILPDYWRGILNDAIVETIVRNVLEPYKNWFVPITIRIHHNDEVLEKTGEFDWSFFVDVTVEIISSREIVGIRIEIERSNIILLIVNNNDLFTVNNNILFGLNE